MEECYRCWWCAYRGPSQCHLGGSGKKQCSLEKSLQMVRWVEGQKSRRERVRTDGGGPIWILLAVVGGYTPLAWHPATQPAPGGCGALLWPHLPLPPHRAVHLWEQEPACSFVFIFVTNTFPRMFSDLSVEVGDTEQRDFCGNPGFPEIR